MAEEYEKYTVMRNLFRRRSSVEFTGEGYDKFVPVNQVPFILSQMGSRVSAEEISKHLDKIDNSQTGRLTFDQYQKVCDKFVQNTSNAAAVSHHGFKGFSDFDS